MQKSYNNNNRNYNNRKQNSNNNNNYQNSINIKEEDVWDSPPVKNNVNSNKNSGRENFNKYSHDDSRNRNRDKHNEKKKYSAFLGVKKDKYFSDEESNNNNNDNNDPWGSQSSNNFNNNNSNNNYNNKSNFNPKNNNKFSFNDKNFNKNRNNYNNNQNNNNNFHNNHSNRNWGNNNNNNNNNKIYNNKNDTNNFGGKRQKYDESNNPSFNTSKNNNTNTNNNNNNSNYKKPRNYISSTEREIIKELPIHSVKEKILQEISNNRAVIISGNTGCGKSTQVPQYIYKSNPQSKILMTQPRRIAAVSIAKRLCDEMKERLGDKIGFHVSMSPNFSLNSKILVKTTGIFLEELIHKNLDYTHIIIDEVHERDIYVDLVLALIKWYFDQNPKSKIKLILMSATITEADFAYYLRDINGDKEVPIISIKENWHTVHTFTLDDIFNNIKNDAYITPDLRTNIEKLSTSCFGLMKCLPTLSEELFPVVASILEKIENQNPNCLSGVLIFLPGLAEIQELQEYLARYFLAKNKLEFLILHSQISDDEQDRVFKSNLGKRKIILATNIAESSITISNVDFVIDFCLVKQTRFDEYQNTSVLELKWCSKASCMQRKGRTGRVGEGYYFQLISQKLLDQLDQCPTPEILRSPLEGPILKLKIYEPDKEPGDILMKTINPPSQETILNTLFRLEKMGALIKGTTVNELDEENIIKKNVTVKNLYGYNYEYKEENKNNNNDSENSENSFYNNNNLNHNEKEINCQISMAVHKPKKFIYKSGIITKVGRIFAELPIDIKYSRLIILAYALGEIDLGITLAAIISQDKSMFLSSDKCNRYNLYNSKNYYCFEKECDFIASYTAYKNWLYKYGHLFIRKDVKFDTQLKVIDKKQYKEIQKYTLEHVLDLRVLKEIIKVENDLKKRLCKFKLYSTHLESYKDPTKSINFKQNEDSFLLKVILAGTFYNQIFSPEFDDIRNIEEEILRTNDVPDQDMPSELYTIRITDIDEDKAKKLIDILDAIVQPDAIVDEKYNPDSEVYKIKVSKIEAVKKILFITSAAIKRNREIPVFQYIKNNEINNNINRANLIGNDTDNIDNCDMIKLIKEPEYYYRVHYYDEYFGENVFPDKDSVNLIQVIPNLELLKNTKLVTDSYNNKSGNSMRKFSRYSSVLPPIENFDKFMMLIFAPQYEMVGYKNQKTKKYLKYIGFQSYEFTGLRGFYNYDINDPNFTYERALFIKLDYVLTNYHLKIINEIRILINEMMKFKFLSKNEKDNYNINNNIITYNYNNINNYSNVFNKIENVGNDDISKEEFEELYREYKSKSHKIIELIKQLVYEKKIKNISDEKYQELFDYITECKYKNPGYFESAKIHQNFTDKEEEEKEEKKISEEEENEKEFNKEYIINKEKGDEENIPEYTGYINAINDLKKQVSEDDFLQLHEPLPIQGEFQYNNRKMQKDLITKERKIKNLYNDYLVVIRRMESLAFSKEAWLVCSECCKEICALNPGNPVLTNQEIGEYKIEGSWINENLKIIEGDGDREKQNLMGGGGKNKKKNKKRENKNSCFYNEAQKNEFIMGLKENKIKFDNLFTCPSDKHIIGYVRGSDRYFYFGSSMSIKYPDLSIEKINNKDLFLNNFQSVHKRVNRIMSDKERPEFKNNIFCQLCHFKIQKDLKEFKNHLKEKDHNERLKELRREFI